MYSVSFGSKLHVSIMKRKFGPVTLMTIPSGESVWVAR